MKKDFEQDSTGGKIYVSLEKLDFSAHFCILTSYNTLNINFNVENIHLLLILIAITRKYFLCICHKKFSTHIGNNFIINKSG